MALKICVICGKEFDTRYSSNIAKTCSNECRRERSLNTPRQKKCVICGDIFQPYHKNQVRCYDKECIRLHKNLMARNRYKHKQKKCVICGVEFHPNGRDKTCGENCRVKYRRLYRINYNNDPVNKNRAKKTNALRYQKNRDAILSKGEIYRNREDIKKRRKEWHIKYYSRPEIKMNFRKHSYNRRARKNNHPNTFTSEEWQECLNYFNGCCAVCERQLNDIFGEFTAAMDHWIPLSYEGEDNPGTVVTNIVPLCHGVGGCNNSKNNTMPDVWLRQNYSEYMAKKIERRIQAYFESVKS